MINDIISAIADNCVLVSRHGKEEAEKDNLTLDEIYHSVTQGEIIEDYPDDNRGHSCLIFGFTPQGNPIHSVWAYNESTGYAILITVYHPDPKQWINWRIRKLD